MGAILPSGRSFFEDVAGSGEIEGDGREPHLDSAVPAELVAVAGRLNNAFRRFGSGWVTFVEAQRHPAGHYPRSVFPDPASALVDAERRADFEGDDDERSPRWGEGRPTAHYESSYFLTFAYLPPAEDVARAERFLYEGRDRTKGADAREVLRGFVDRTDRVFQLIDGFMPACAWLDDAETLTCLHSTISTRRQRVRLPETPMYLDALLADQPLTGGFEPRLGSAHLRVLTVTGFPSATTPGILDDLNRLAFPYRWSTRAILLDKTDATRLLTKIRRQWFAKRKSVAAILKEVMTNEASALVDTDAHNKALDADAALQELGADIAGEAYVTATITVWDDVPRIADEKLRLVEKIIQGRDFTVMAETVNAVDAWLGSLPGHVYANVRQPPVSTLNLAHMIPLSAVWAGPERDDHFDAPPLLYGKTEGATPFRFALHVGDVGHTLVVGPTGAGKSVLLALMALQFRRYPGSQVFAFDFGGSIRAAALAMGGDWHDLGGDLSTGNGSVEPRSHSTGADAIGANDSEGGNWVSRAKVPLHWGRCHRGKRQRRRELECWRCAATAGPYPRRARTRLGRRLAGRDPAPRGHHRRSAAARASLGSAHLAGLGACRRAHHHRPVGSAPEPGPQTRAPALLCWWTLWPAARCGA